MWPTKALAVVAALFVLLPVAVHAEEEEKSAIPESPESGAKEHAARTSSRDIKVPEALVARIEREYKAFLAKQEGANKEEIKRSLVNITVELSQKHPGALHEDTRMTTPTGGGVIDLSEAVTPVRGAFRVAFQTKKDDGQPLSTSRVYFVSHAKPRILGGEEYGDGCNKYMEITTPYHKKWEKNGFEVYTADQRYLSVLGGTFIFVEYAKEALYVASVTFMDSRYPDLLCE